MGSRITSAEREQRKIATIHHGAYVNVINEVEPKDYRNFSTATGKRYIEDLTADYKNLIRLIEASDPNGKKLTFIEKAVCFIMSLKNNKTFFLKNDVKKGSKLSTINERMIVQAILYFLTCSTYRVHGNHGKIILSGQFDYSGYDNGHKRELNIYKKALLDIISEFNFDDNAALEIINRIYLRGIMYKEELDLELEDKIRSKISIVESLDVPFVEQTLNPEFVEFKKKFRM